MKFGKSWQSKGELKIDCLNFTNCSVEKLQLCNYFENFLKRTEFLKDIVAADREGDWKAPLLVVQNILPMFSEFDSINYLQYGSLCLENMHCQLSSSFNAVAGDMRLYNVLGYKSIGGFSIGGHTRWAEYVTKREIVYHKIVSISDAFREITALIFDVEKSKFIMN